MQESAAIKGVLIFLIILGHNMLFTYYVLPVRGMEYLYCFHIHAFFILPFLYGSKPLTKQRLGDYFIRLYWPFLLLTLVVSVIYAMIGYQRWDALNIIRMWLTGEPKLLKEYCGVQIFWFMPAIFSLSVLKDLFYHSGKLVRSVLIMWSVFILILSSGVIKNDVCDLLYSKLSSTLPFGLYIGSSYLVYGVVTRYIVGIVGKYYRNVSGIVTALFVACSLLYFCYVFFFLNEVVYTCLRLVMPVLFMLGLWCFRHYIGRLSFCEKLGDKSYPVYLCHPFIGYAVYGLFMKIDGNLSLVWAIGAQCLILYGAYYLSVILYKMPGLRMFLLPKSISEFKNGSKIIK